MGKIDNDGLDIPDARRLEILERYPLRYIGPSWKMREDGMWDMPEYSLGPQIAGWAFRYLRGLSDEGGRSGFRFTPEQFRFLCHWYALDEYGDFKYSVGVLQRVKGWGKDPFAAVLALAEAMGPVRFSHWVENEDGHQIAVGKMHPNPIVQVVAVSEQQTRNLTSVFNSLVTPHLKDRYNFQPRSDISRARDRMAEIKASASSFRSIEGDRTTFAVLDEALCLETPIATPTGYKRFGSLRPGDPIVGSNGKITRITHVKPVQTDRKCVEVRYATGESVVASDGHLWLAKIGSNGAAQVMKTADMMDHKDEVFIPAPPTVDLDTVYGIPSFRHHDFAARLPIGVSLLPIGQRISILRAAWQYFGSVNKRGDVVYQMATKQRHTAMLALLRSFGIARITNAVGTSITCQPYFNVTDLAEAPHKLHDQPKWIPVRLKSVPSRPVRCITVEAEDSLFLAGLAHMVTHNTQHWVPAKQGQDLYQTIANNLSKTGGRSLSITNAPRPGEQSVGEEQRMQVEQQLNGVTKPGSYMLYDSIEAHPDTPIDEADVVRVVFPKLRGDSNWLRTRNVLNALQDTSISVAQLRRMWFNQTVATDDALFTLEELTTVLKPLSLKPNDEVILGFDGGWSDDATALVALRPKDMSFHVLGIWEKPVGRVKWEVNPDDVTGRLSSVFKRHKVLGMFCDTRYWEPRVADWEKEFGRRVKIRAHKEKPFAFPMGGKKADVCRAVEMLVSGVRDQKMLLSDENKALVAHFQNAVARETLQGLSFRKETEDSPRKVDLLAAATLAVACYEAGRAAGVYRKGQGHIRIQGGIG